VVGVIRIRKELFIMTCHLRVGTAMGVCILGVIACSSADSSTPDTPSIASGNLTGGTSTSPTGGAVVADGQTGPGDAASTDMTANAQAAGGTLNTGGGPSAVDALNTGGTVATGEISSSSEVSATGGAATENVAASGGNSSTGGTGTGGRGRARGTGGATASGGAAPLPVDLTTTVDPAEFSFFVTSLEALRELSGNVNGFGGDLRYGEATGLEGADKICQTIATNEGFGHKTWRAFLSVTAGPDGVAVHAIDRIGVGPWYDRLGRLVASGVAGLLANRPNGLAEVVNDLPNEKGVQEHTANTAVDDHDTITGSNTQGRLYQTTLASTCNDWTSAVAATGRPMAGHSWPGGPSLNWIQAHTMNGCAPGVCLSQAGGGCGTACPTGGIGCSGGYGGFYCFALTP
jgi:hypothetical protein